MKLSQLMIASIAVAALGIAMMQTTAGPPANAPNGTQITAIVDTSPPSEAMVDINAPENMIVALDSVTVGNSGNRANAPEGSLECAVPATSDQRVLPTSVTVVSNPNPRVTATTQQATAGAREGSLGVFPTAADVFTAEKCA
ncbi:MAG: hypothetical protein NTW11_03025 [Candidatus Staskawiczbacteria bacterium]|nr:hypothetical protein [Candidatus Staskawiczbacteria bacterium]